MSFRAVGMLLGAVLIPIMGGFQVWYTDRNYLEAEASLISVSKDCYFERDSNGLHLPGSESISYFDCSRASEIAKKYGYERNDVKPHARLLYSYVSPQGQETKQAEYELWREGVSDANLKAKRPVYISRDPSGEVRWSKNFIF